MFMPHSDHNLFGSQENLLRECLGVSCAHFVVGDELLVNSFVGQVLGIFSSEEVAGMVDADGAVAAGVIGSLDCLAAVKSSRQTFHVAIRHASRPLRCSSIGMWIFFSGVPKVISFANFSGPFGDFVIASKEHGQAVLGSDTCPIKVFENGAVIGYPVICESNLEISMEVGHGSKRRFEGIKISLRKPKESKENDMGHETNDGSTSS